MHYTIFNNKGDVVSSGAIKTLFDGNQNDINKISKTQFALIADKLTEKMVGAKPE